jgi:uncharacterized protein (UPF0248 family)
MNYNIIVYLDDETEITIPTENEYTLRQNVTGIGNNGVWQQFDKDFLFIPSHRILKIEVKEDKK